MTAQQIELLELDIAPIDNRAILIVGSGLEWLMKNTTLEFDMNKDEDLKALPYCAKLFLVQFFDINDRVGGVSSESIEGLSQSYDTTSKNDLIWQSAEELLSDYLKPRVRFVPAQRKWR